MKPQTLVSDLLLGGCAVRSPETELHEFDDNGRYSAVLKNRRLSRYFKLSYLGVFIWKRLDGSKTVNDLTQEVVLAGGPRSAAIIASLVQRWIREGFADGDDLTPQNATTPGAFSAPFPLDQCYRLLTATTRLTNVDPTFTKVYEGARDKLVSLPAKLIAVSVTTLGAISFLWKGLGAINEFNHVHSITALLVMIPAGLSCAICHEVSHALAVKHFNKEVVGVGVGWFFFGPVFFVDTSDMWLGTRWQRISVSLAGPCSDLFIAGALSLIAWLVSPILSNCLRFFSGFLYLTVLNSMCPLLEYDGYYILSDLLRHPNLRRRSLGLLISVCKDWRLLKGHNKISRVEILYAVVSLLYFAALVRIDGYFLHSNLSHLLHEAHSWWLRIFVPCGVAVGICSAMTLAIGRDLWTSSREV